MVESFKPSKVSKTFSMVINQGLLDDQIVINRLERVSLNFTEKEIKFKILTGLGGRSGRERVSANDIQPEASDMMNNLVESDAQPVQM